MPLGWFSQPKASDVDALIQRKKYAKAIELIRAASKKRPGDKRLLRRLGDVLVMAGQIKEAVKVLDTLADEVALRGNAAEAIAILKKIQQLDPGRPEIEEKLAYYITHQAEARRKRTSAWDRKRRAAPEPSGASAAEIEFGMEEIGDAPVVELGTGSAEPAAPERKPPKRVALQQPVAPPAPASRPSDAAAADGSKAISFEEFSESDLRDELQSLFEEVLAPLDEAADAAAAERRAEEASKAQTPLFQRLSQEELVEVMRGLELASYAPGEIVVSEGEPGDSLFVITRGAVRAYVRDAEGRQRQVRELGEGDFFGEIAVMQAGARTATITAALPSEMLVLDKVTLDAIAQRHPHVREVMQSFHDQRAGSTLEAAVRKRAGT